MKYNVRRVLDQTEVVEAARLNDEGDRATGAEEARCMVEDRQPDRAAILVVRFVKVATPFTARFVK